MISTSNFDFRCRTAVLPAVLIVVSLVLHLLFTDFSVSRYDARSSLGLDPVQQLPHQLGQRAVLPNGFDGLVHEYAKRQSEPIDYESFICKGQRALEKIENDAPSGQVSELRYFIPEPFEGRSLSCRGEG